MATFDDAADPELGDACNRLAAWVEPMPADAIVDRASGLSERDLALILRHLHATRLAEPVGAPVAGDAPTAPGRISVPITARDR